MNLPSVKDLSLFGKTVLLRTNYDVPLLEQESGRVKEWEVGDDSRIVESLPTINFLLEQKAKVIIISHLGRPEGKMKQELSLKTVADSLFRLLNEKLKIKNEKLQFKIKNFLAYQLTEKVFLLENIRFYPEEERNDLEFAKQLASLADFYVNDAFACSHREHASIVGVPQFLPSAFGWDFLTEIETLSKLRENPRRPVVVVLGGAKEDKLETAEKLVNWADNILIGGKLPILISNFPASPAGGQFPISNLEKIVVAQLKPDGKDITLESAGAFQKMIQQAGTILWAGPMGVFEQPESEQGTREIARAISESQAFKVVGGGDTETALTKFNLEKKIDYISSGGGAMFEFLAKGTLPGIEAITKKNF